MDLHELFVAVVLPQLRPIAASRLKGFADCPERIKLAEAWGWYLVVYWTAKGRACEVWRVIAAAVLKAVHNRPIPGSVPRRAHKGGDALDDASSGGGMDGVANRGASWEHVAELAEEYRRWLDWCLPAKQRKIAKDLARGMTTADAARKYRVSAGRISQLRMEFRTSWYRWWNRE